MSRPLRVLQSFPAGNSKTNPYLLQLVAALGKLDPPVYVTYFTWRAALVGRYDLLHVHWPERLVRGGSPARTLAKQVRFIGLLLRLTVLDTPVVRTLHNLGSHEQGSRLERLLLRLLERKTIATIRLNPYSPVPAPSVAHLIPHGHYRNWIAASPTRRTADRLLFFGLIRPYKGVEELIGAFRRTSPPLTLEVVGPVDDPALGSQLTEAAQTDRRISTDFRFLPDEELAERIAAASLVVLPYQDVHNSGAAIFALSLNRPVLMPRTDTTTWLQDEVGRGWVITYDPPLRPEDLVAALRSAESSDLGGPVFDNRDWPLGAAAHAAAYHDALSRRRSFGGRSRW